MDNQFRASRTPQFLHNFNPETKINQAEIPQLICDWQLEYFGPISLAKQLRFGFGVQHSLSVHDGPTHLIVSALLFKIELVGQVKGEHVV